ncbi:MAG: hypothetical protein J0M12_13425 [Deltaproteobacteria bacterium]|nr:hypothetical protein [Deltaproteobacteria bacterium]
MEKLFLGIDQGSSGTKGVLLDMHGQHYQEFSVPVSTHVIDEMQIEQDPLELLRSVRHVADDALRAADRLRKHIAGIGLSLQRSGVCAWDSESGAVLHRLITHRDRRTKAQLDEMNESHAIITRKSGLPVVPHYAAGKIALLQREFPDPKALISTLDSFIVQRFAGDSRFITEDSMAARTMLYGLGTAAWDDELCQIFSVQASRLPTISSSLGQHGTYRGIPITAMLGDQQASLFGRMAEGINALLNIGTISSLAIFTGDSPVFQQGFVTSVLYSEGSVQREFKYILEAISGASGPLIDFIVKDLGAAQSIDEIAQICVAVPEEQCPVAFFPLGSSGSPDWTPGLPNVVKGWDRTSQRPLVRALIENMGNFIAQSILLLSETGILTPQHYPLAVSGGLSDLDFLMQHIADVSGVELSRLSSREATARGAAIASMYSWNKGKPRGMVPRHPEKRLFKPQVSKARERFAVWRDLREQASRGEVPTEYFFTLPE